MRGDGEHSYGHSDSCYWCGYNPDEDAPKPVCDERLNAKPTPAQMSHYACTTAIEEAKYELEQAELACEDNGYRGVGKEVYGLRLQLSEVLRRLEDMRPAEHKGVATEDK